MKIKGIVFLVLCFLSTFFCEKSFSSVPTVTHHQYKTKEVTVSAAESPRENDVLFNLNNTLRVLHIRLVKSVDFLKVFALVTGNTTCYPTYSKYKIYSGNDTSMPFTKLLLFPHHVFW